LPIDEHLFVTLEKYVRNEFHGTCPVQGGAPCLNF
jgi:hypothetical protein